MNYHGTLIYRERLRRNWSQEGLCRGICTVSYLSKIENGRAEPSEEILRLLLERLGLKTDPVLEAEAARLAEEAYELLFSGRDKELRSLIADDICEKYRATAAGLDLLLIQQTANGGEPLDVGLESCMTPRQLALQRVLQERYAEAMALLPNAWSHFQMGLRAYCVGDDTVAMQYLQAGYDLAAKEGAPRLMLECRAFMGNCCSNRRDLVHMQAHYAVARRLAAALNAQDMLRMIDYNTASTQLECGKCEEAYVYFSKLTEPDVMSLHKLAVCCEKTGRPEEALSALNRADSSADTQLELHQARQMCALVRYRLEHPDHMHSEEYGRLLLECFEMCRKELPIGYAYFHLPWVIDWYKATRQYKKAFELMTEFPANIN